MKVLPNFTFEKQIWKKGYTSIAGIDEVGRGCFAGPVVASAVVFEKGITGIKSTTSATGEKAHDTLGTRDTRGTLKINDSKKLTKLQRERAAIWIKENCLVYGIGEASASTINRIGIVKATQIAFRNAIKIANAKLQMTNEEKGQIPSQARHDGNARYIDYLLIDAFYIPYVKGLRRKNQKAIIKGDSKSISIASASIIAKVHRDALMEKIGKRRRYKKYDWCSNKGYGTKVHLEAIKKYGVNGYHRKMFVETYLNGIITSLCDQRSTKKSRP